MRLAFEPLIRLIARSLLRVVVRPWRRLWLAASNATAWSNSRTVPFSIVTPPWPWLLIPASVRSAAGIALPSIVCPLRSSVMLSAPITRPSPAQLVRLRCRVVFVVITAPQLGVVASAGLPPSVIGTPTASATAAACSQRVGRRRGARLVWSRPTGLAIRAMRLAPAFPRHRAGTVALVHGPWHANPIRASQSVGESAVRLVGWSVPETEPTPVVELGSRRSRRKNAKRRVLG